MAYNNSIALVTKYTPYLDQVYKYASRSSVLDAREDLVKETADAKTVLIAKTSMEGLGNYSRNGGFVDGDVTLTWESHTMTKDRGRSFQIDAMDNLETLGIAYGTLASEFIRTKVVPEVDAYRFSSYADKAGHIATGTLDASSAVAAIDAAIVAMKEAEVDLTGAFLFVTPTVMNYVKNSSKWTRPLTPGENPNSNFGMYDELTIIEVPQARFINGITFNDGSTVGQEAGGFAKRTQSTETFTGDGSEKVFTITATEKPQVLDEVKVDGAAKTEGTDFTYDRTTGKITFGTAPAATKTVSVKYGKARDINFLIVKPEAVIQIAKHGKMRVFDPDVNQKADAYKVDYRIYHDAWALENKLDGIYAHCKAAG